VVARSPEPRASSGTRRGVRLVRAVRPEEGPRAERAAGAPPVHARASRQRRPFAPRAAPDRRSPRSLLRVASGLRPEGSSRGGSSASLGLRRTTSRGA